MAKRLFDIVVSFVGLTLASPVLLGLAIAIKLESRGPVFYRGVRVGRFGKPFRIFKFRSMVVNAEALGGSSTSGTDTRVTRVGAFVRKFKLDELPQLINVLVGNMSLVGPRPQVQWAVDLFTPEERQILELRPGITDWASIKFSDEGGILERSGIADPDVAYMKLIHPEKTRLQLKYLRERTFWGDLIIIFTTISTIITSRFEKTVRS